MNLRVPSSSIFERAFCMVRAVATLLPGGRISALGAGPDKIGSILVINLDRQPRRWRRVLREVERFRTADGSPLRTITRRVPAVDARDSRAVAPTADVDPMYRLGDQLYVQPDPMLAQCFDVNEPIRMTRQEVAIARSHIEVWKTIVSGSENYVLVLEDDVWFAPGAATAIDRGWHAALQRCRFEGGPTLLYFSYADAGGTAERLDLCDALFRPARGLWFLSGYVLSRNAAAALLRAMPVVGPVDLWLNHRFKELGALALSRPMILQRPDAVSDNSYSILPYLARAGIVDSHALATPLDQPRGPVLAWSAGRQREGLSMALSMLGLRVRTFDGHEKAIQAQDLENLLETFDAIVDAPIAPDALCAAIARVDTRFVLEANSAIHAQIKLGSLPHSRTAVLSDDTMASESWEILCALLGLAKPVQSLPFGAPRSVRLFRDDRQDAAHPSNRLLPLTACPLDDSPWVLPPRSDWRPIPPTGEGEPNSRMRIIHAPMTIEAPPFSKLLETFPGNLAFFARAGVVHGEDGASFVASKVANGNKSYRSGAIASRQSFEYGRFEAEIKAAKGAGLVTGFFLYRNAPRQEIDIELVGNDPHCMRVNVFFNPGDEGANMSYGYRGSPFSVELSFDATMDFHRYAIDWRPGRIAWLVDGRTVHQRVGWDPTPVPHLPMRLNANLWISRSAEFAGKIHDDVLPAISKVRNISVWA